MLTREILIANASLSGLSDEQITAITTLSQNDENSVIAKKTGEIYGALDADILEVSGIAKNGTEKTYDYAKRVNRVCEYEHMTWDELKDNISSVVKLYDVGGEKEDIGKKSHNAYINAIRAFQKFVNNH